MVGPGQLRLDAGFVALVPVVDQIVGDVVVEQRGVVRRRMLGMDGGGQFLIIHRDPFGGVARLCRGLRHDQRDRMADMAHPVFRQNAVGRVRALRPVAVLDRNHAGQVAQTVGGHVGPCQDADHARRHQGVGNIDAENAGVGMGRAQDMGPGLAVDRGIVGIGACAGHQHPILDSGRSLANSEFGHRFSCLLDCRRADTVSGSETARRRPGRCAKLSAPDRGGKRIPRRRREHRTRSVRPGSGLANVRTRCCDFSPHFFALQRQIKGVEAAPTLHRPVQRRLVGPGRSARP